MDIFEKITRLGGVKQSGKRPVTSDLPAFRETIANIMGNLPEEDVLSFASAFGFTSFNKNVVSPVIEHSSFLKSGTVDIGMLFGIGQQRNSVLSIIDTYFFPEQIRHHFFPICAGYPGDIIFYSLEKETFGKIYYWHHESPASAAPGLVAHSFDSFLAGLMVNDTKETNEVLTPEELIKINERRKKVGLPLIDQFRNSGN